MSLKPWEFHLTSAMRTAMYANKFDIVNLYIKLEQTAKEYLESGEMKEGDSFKIPLENGAMLTQSFYKGYSTLTLKRPNNKIREVISKDDLYKKEYTFLIGYSEALEDSELGIGARFTEKIKNALSEIKVGQVITFENGRSYVCRCTNGKDIGLTQVSNLTKIPDMSEFEETKEDMVHIQSDLSLQHFYAQVRDDYNDDVRGRFSMSYKTQEIYNQIYAGIGNKLKLVQLGPNVFRVKKALLSRELRWYDNNGKLIPNEKIKSIIGWLNTAPVIMDFKRDEQTYKQEFDDNLLKGEVNQLLSNKEYENAGKMIMAYCEKEKETLSINISSYIDKNDDYQAVSFVFSYNNGKCNISKLTYDDNNYLSDPSYIEESSLEEFIEFCHLKYDENFLYIENDIKSQLLEQYPQYKNDFAKDLMNKFAIEKAKEQVSLDVDIARTPPDIGDLTKSYKDEKIEL